MWWKGTVLINNLTLSGFNSAIVNNGAVTCERVTFSSNIMDYVNNWDYGGAINNQGQLKCVSCNFIDNYAKLGGAVYSNSTSSSASFERCYFKNNKNYAESNILHYFISHWGNGITHIDNYVNRRNEESFICPGHDIYVGSGGFVYVNSLKNGNNLHGPGEYTPTSSKDINFGYRDSDLGHTIVLRDSNMPIVREYVVKGLDSLKHAVDSIMVQVPPLINLLLISLMMWVLKLGINLI